MVTTRWMAGMLMGLALMGQSLMGRAVMGETRPALAQVEQRHDAASEGQLLLEESGSGVAADALKRDGQGLSDGQPGTNGRPAHARMEHVARGSEVLPLTGMGTLLMGAAGLCVLLAAKMERRRKDEVAFSCGVVTRAG